MSLRQRVLAAARARGLEPRLRQVQRATARGAMRRAYVDDEKTTLLLRLGLPEGSQCIDIGANVGMVLQDIVDAYPGVRHLAFEPLPELAADLARRFPDVEVRNAALSDQAGTASFTRNVGALGHSSLTPYGAAATAGTERFDVPVEVLDNVLPDDFRPAFVKIDVEGAEAQVFRGMMKTLQTHRPIVVFEHGDHAARFGTSHGEIYDLLVTEAGLRLFDIDGGGPFDREGFEACANAGGIWTWVART